MSKDRLLAFSDGFFSIIITIMVLELAPPAGGHWPSLRGSLPGVLIYALSFAYLGIYWTNHHHFFLLVEQVDGGVLWANLHLMFWLSLIPFATAWLGHHGSATAPTALYGASLFLPAVAWWFMRRILLGKHAADSKLARGLRNVRKVYVSTALYAGGIALSFWRPWTADALYVLAALLWIVPDRKVEQVVRGDQA